MTVQNPADAPLRPVRLGTAEAIFDKRADGTVIVRHKEPLGAHPDKLTEKLEHWARVKPNAVFLAEMDSGGQWNRLTWAEALSKVRSVAQALIERGLSQDRPVAILSENGIENALLAFGCMMSGVPCVHVSPSYSLLSTDFMKLKHVLGLANPGLVYVDNGERYAKAISGAVGADVEVVVGHSPFDRKGGTTLFSSLIGTRATADVDAAHARVGLDTIGKILFTSGSTGVPKGVPVTQRMIVSNQQAILQTCPFVADDLVLVDWMPWHHTFGGNNNLGMVMYNGGTFNIDMGRPMPGLIEKTVQMLKQVSPTYYMSVPKGVEVLLPLLREDRAAAENMFRNMVCSMFGGAPMPRHLLDELEALQVEVTGERIAIGNGVGSTDAGPTAILANWHVGNKTIVGLPVPGMEAKIVPVGKKLELRLRGPAVVKSYWKDPERTAAAFDEEGFFKIGDAVTYVDQADPQRGFMFDGRVVEDFKLMSGTWVNVGGLRERMIAGLAPYLRDAVITGHGRDYVAAMLFLNVEACRSLCPDLPANATGEAFASHPVVRALAQKVLDSQEASAGSSERIDRVVIESEQPSLDNGEQTDKASVSQRSVLDRRTAVVEELYRHTPSARTIARQRG